MREIVTGLSALPQGVTSETQRNRPARSLSERVRTSRYLTTCTDALHALRCPEGLVLRRAAKPNPQE